MKYHKEKPQSGKIKSPYNQREEGVTKKAFKSVKHSVEPVAKDTNKTRRPRIKPTVKRNDDWY